MCEREREREKVCMCEREYVCERERGREREYVCVCAFVRLRERESTEMLIWCNIDVVQIPLTIMTESISLNFHPSLSPHSCR